MRTLENLKPLLKPKNIPSHFKTTGSFETIAPTALEGRRCSRKKRLNTNAKKAMKLHFIAFAAYLKILFNDFTCSRSCDRRRRAPPLAAPRRVELLLPG